MPLQLVVPDANLTIPISAASMSDAALVAAARHGRAEAFEELYSRHKAKLFGTALRITRSREDAEDALQDCLLNAFLSLKRFDGRSSFSTWLTRIVMNSSLMILRKQRSRRELPMPVTPDGLEAELQVEDHAPNPEAQVATRESETLVRKAVRALRPKVRKVIELRQVQEHSIKETAKALRISVTAAKGRLFHARAALRKSAVLRPLRPVRKARRNSVWAQVSRLERSAQRCA